MRRINKNRGFTLIELVIVIILIAFLSVFGSKIIAAIFNNLYTGENIVNADWQARVGLEQMVRDFRTIQSGSNISNTSTASQFVFTDSTGTTNTYSLKGSQVLFNTQVLVDGAQSLVFTYYDKSGNVIPPPPTALTRYIGIALGINQSTVSFTLSTAVYLWNLR
jgi:prepilin-type N-terminal cleavage/methylation domain-containing protein